MQRNAMSETDEYTVGYRKPPKSSQFRKGQSGNPGGRRRPVVTNANTALAHVLSRRVTVSDEGGESQMSELEALMRDLVNKARAGNTSCLKLVLGRLASIEDDESAQQEFESLCEKAAREEARAQREDAGAPEPEARPPAEN
jgi:hypothetical protein